MGLLAISLQARCLGNRRGVSDVQVDHGGCQHSHDERGSEQEFECRCLHGPFPSQTLSVVDKTRDVSDRPATSKCPEGVNSVQINEIIS